MNEHPCARHRPSFFKVMIGDFRNRLQIPTAFVKNLGGLHGVFPQKYSIFNSAGRRWSVEVDKSDNKLYFQSGWKEFAEDNSLKMGEFLVFRCHGRLEFFVQIYGRSYCEREVGFAREKRGGNDIEFEQCVIVETDSDGESADIEVEQASQDNATGYVEQSSQEENVEASRKSTSVHPVYKVVMKPAYLRGALHISTSLGKYAQNNQLVKLQSSNKTWTVRIKKYGRAYKLCAGWAKFTRENKLRFGDICIFKLINDKDVTFAVSIHR